MHSNNHTYVTSQAIAYIRILEYSFKLVHLVPTWPSQLALMMPQPTQSGSYVCIKITTVHRQFTSQPIHSCSWAFTQISAPGSYLIQSFDTHDFSTHSVKFLCMHSNYHTYFTSQPMHSYSWAFTQISAPGPYLIQSVDLHHESIQSVRFLCMHSNYHTYFISQQLHSYS